MSPLATTPSQPAPVARSKKALRQARRRRRASSRPRDLGPTPETKRQLQEHPDAWRVLLDWRDAKGHALIDPLAEQAAAEIRAVFSAICRNLLRTARLAAGRSGGGMPDIPDHLARAHAVRYLPWVADTGPRVTDAILSLVHDGHWTATASPDEIADALMAYARRMRGRDRTGPKIAMK
ncbi:MAG: hypothetical protein AB7O88_22000 [Reyranellaceae bacterium]